MTFGNTYIKICVYIQTVLKFGCCSMNLLLAKLKSVEIWLVFLFQTTLHNLPEPKSELMNF